MNLDRLVELGELNLLNKRNSICQRIGLGFHLLRRGSILLTGLLTHNVDWFNRLRLRCDAPSPPNVKYELFTVA